MDKAPYAYEVYNKSGVLLATFPVLLSAVLHGADKAHRIVRKDLYTGLKEELI